jgi:homoserine O-acetyltransferase
VRPTPTLPRLDNPQLIAPARQLVLDAPLALDCGQTLPRATVNFETYGCLTDCGDNAILICHSLTHRAHAGGRHSAEDRGRGWWDGAIGPGKLLDTDKYFVICTDALAAGGTTGPASVDPATGRPYGMRFPVLTVRDMVNLQSRFIRRPQWRDGDYYGPRSPATA